MRRIGVLTAFTAQDSESKARISAFRQGLQQAGWTDGHNVRIDIRWAAGEAERYRRYAAELVALTPDVILANGGPALRPLQQATRTVPIVFVNVADPVAAGFVASLARPGGNITGFTQSEYTPTFHFDPSFGRLCLARVVGRRRRVHRDSLSIQRFCSWIKSKSFQRVGGNSANNLLIPRRASLRRLRLLFFEAPFRDDVGPSLNFHTR